MGGGSMGQGNCVFFFGCSQGQGKKPIRSLHVIACWERIPTSSTGLSNLCPVRRPAAHHGGEAVWDLHSLKNLVTPQSWPVLGLPYTLVRWPVEVCGTPGEEQSGAPLSGTHFCKHKVLQHWTDAQQGLMPARLSFIVASVPYLTTQQMGCSLRGTVPFALVAGGFLV